MSDERYEKGMARRREVLGAEYVDRASGNSTSFDEDFQRFIAEGVWGSVWTRPGLETRERSLVVLAILASLGHHDELALHVRATRNTGATMDDVKEVMMMVAAYAGVPAANSAIAVAKRAFGELEKQDR